MTLNQLLPSLKELSHDEKVRAFEFLKKELEQEEMISPGKEYHIFTPDPCPEAAVKLMELLEQHDKTTI